MPLKHLSYFWRSFEIPIINFKIELEVKLTFTIKDTKLYVPVVTLSTKDNQKLSKLLSTRFERSVHWNVRLEI